MGAVQTLEPGEFTLADLDALPDDGMRYELVDGTLLVTPPRCRSIRPLAAFVAPVDFRPNKHKSLQPDVLVCRQQDVGPKAINFLLLEGHRVEASGLPGIRRRVVLAL